MIPTEETPDAEIPDIIQAPSDEIPKINQPKRHKAKVIVCMKQLQPVFTMHFTTSLNHILTNGQIKTTVMSDLSVDAVDRLNESLNADHVKQVLADIFELDNYKTDLKTGIIMDLYYYTLQFAKEQKFSAAKTSTFFSIIKKVFEVCIETPFGNLDHTFEYFKDLILCHSVNRPPYSIQLFTPNEVRKVTEYTINSFFRHFKMYKYAFTPSVRLDLNISYEGMPPTPPPSEGSLVKPAEGTPDEEAHPDEEGETKEIDSDKQSAEDELRNMVKEFLNTEAKRIEGSIDQRIKTAVDFLNAKVDPIIGTATKDTKGKKK